ncbi:hypothetical protein AYO21_06737 [Fonsecaea monophora]|uniref:C2H2-type domain-containing protein n=1 Tax=Fonsecaea monophora TaxID=254056 RepID=A0A177F3V3_9EURO|nr:hypothetical protein AYO21_06737 [Fonsecaea monophora]KAH0829781.1 hypothetical protein FOPE_10684 [Fonsecaea pedrosoi]OAG39017.1 hypothetical protein AYO21_06737 [Fonsecaea monophora]
MPRENQALIDVEGVEFVCISCDEREFDSEQALLQHCQAARCHQDEWCDRCQWLFISTQAHEQHTRDSQNHWVCSKCGTDEPEESSLRAHMETKHSFCYDCQANFAGVSKHRVQFHNRCSICDEEFANENEVRMVRGNVNIKPQNMFLIDAPQKHAKIHTPRQNKCYGCERKFKSPSGILIHLESTTCDSEVTQVDIDKWAFSCHRSNLYTNGWYDEFRYRCPSCDDSFPKVSGLLQHVETAACGAGYNGILEKLTRYIKRQVQNVLE